MSLRDKETQKKSTLVVDIDSIYIEKMNQYCEKHNIKKKRFLEVMVDSFFSEKTRPK